MDDEIGYSSNEEDHSHEDDEPPGTADANFYVPSDREDSDDEVPVKKEPIQLATTRKKREKCWDDVHKRVLIVLHQMELQGLNLPIFLDALSWGTPECTTDPSIRYARSTLLHSKELPDILLRWWKPPRSRGSHKPRARGAKDAIEKVARLCLIDVHERELATVALFLKTQEDKLLTELAQVDIHEITRRMQEHAPNLWAFLYRTAYTPKQENRNTMKCPDMVRVFFL